MRIPLRHRQSHLAVEVQPEGGAYHVVVDGTPHLVEAHQLDDASMVLVVDGRNYRVAIARDGRQHMVAVAGEVHTLIAEAGGASADVATVAAPEITAPMPGKVLQVLVQPGDRVEAGDGLLLLEAMKMESRLTAEAAGAVAEVRVAAGDMVEGGQVLLVLRYEDAQRPAD
ncbi:MAG TPA: biotin/lipoyl-containing protein [Candidatus Margulisiibacteriota bacterium]|nr:biotin/lipoyl-containing protein [Candidatus Margulisiibacteriota bacterium]